MRGLGSGSFDPKTLAILEAAVVVFEAAAIAWAGELALSRALVVSLVANAGSFAYHRSRTAAARSEAEMSGGAPRRRVSR